MKRYIVLPYIYQYETSVAFYYVWNNNNSAQVGGNFKTKADAQKLADERNAAYETTRSLSN